MNQYDTVPFETILVPVPIPLNGIVYNPTCGTSK